MVPTPVSLRPTLYVASTLAGVGTMCSTCLIVSRMGTMCSTVPDQPKQLPCATWVMDWLLHELDQVCEKGEAFHGLNTAYRTSHAPTIWSMDDPYLSQGLTPLVYTMGCMP